ncbi:MAG: S8 family peptidase [Elusimicrobia bacterium]|nr:S8 family peptidase [Elusimicrobiota bacterium]
MVEYIGSVFTALLLVFSSAAPTWAAAPAAAPRPSSHVIVFQDGTTAQQRQAILAQAGGKVVREIPSLDAVVVEDQGFKPDAAMRLKAEPAVESVEPDVYSIWVKSGPAPLSSVAIPSVREALKAGGDVPALGAGVAKASRSAGQATVPWGVQRVGAPGAWSRTTGQGVKVAVIDTGIDASHPDLAPNYAGGVNIIDPQSDPMDDHGHGTHVAGTIAGAGVGRGVVGVAPRARLYAVKVLDAKGGGTNSAIAEGIAWAVDNGMQVINMSLGGPSSSVLKKAVQKAYQAGITIVCAAGNDPNAPVSAPASYPETIAVSASASDDSLASFSSTGPEVDFVAPGQDIVSTWPGGKYAKLSGTSMASPHVAGLAALAIGLGADSPAAVKSMLRGAAAPVDGLDKNQQGYGMVNAAQLGQ